MTEAQRKLRDEAAKLYHQKTNTGGFFEERCWLAGHDFAHERARLLERALEAILKWEHPGRHTTTIARAALAEWRGAETECPHTVVMFESDKIIYGECDQCHKLVARKLSPARASEEKEG